MESTMNEAQLQAKCFQWHWNEYPEKRRTLFAIPNGAYLSNIKEAYKLKATGLVAGVADMCLIVSNSVIFIELKTETENQSGDQIRFMTVCFENNIMYVVIKSFEDFVKFIKDIYV